MAYRRVKGGKGEITLQKLSEIRCPTLVVQGIRDKTNHPEMSEVLAKSINTSELFGFSGRPCCSKRKLSKNT